MVIWACLSIIGFMSMALRLRHTEKNTKTPPLQPIQYLSIKLLALEQWAGRLLPSSYESWLERRLFAAGHPKGVDVKTLFVRQLMLSIGFLGLGVILPLQGGLWTILFLTGLGFLLPLFKLQTPIREREKEVRRGVRNWLIVLIPLLEVNLHFQTTLFDVFRREKGVLFDEGKRVRVQVAGGRPLRDALWDAAARIQVREFHQLVRVLADGDRYGPQEMAVKLKELKTRMDRDYRRKAKKEIRETLVRLFFVVLLFIFVPMIVLGFLILLQSMKHNLPL